VNRWFSDWILFAIKVKLELIELFRFQYHEEIHRIVPESLTYISRVWRTQQFGWVIERFKLKAAIIERKLSCFLERCYNLASEVIWIVFDKWGSTTAYSGNFLDQVFAATRSNTKRVNLDAISTLLCQINNLFLIIDLTISQHKNALILLWKLFLAELDLFHFCFFWLLLFFEKLSSEQSLKETIFLLFFSDLRLIWIIINLFSVRNLGWLFVEIDKERIDHKFQRGVNVGTAHIGTHLADLFLD